MTNQQMQDKARQERNNYQRQWRARNKDRVKAINARYWLKRAQRKEEAEHEQTAAD